MSTEATDTGLATFQQQPGSPTLRRPGLQATAADAPYGRGTFAGYLAERYR